LGWEANTRSGSRVGGVGLDTATDAEIQLAFLHGPPPKAIWVRLGSVTTVEIHNVLGENGDEIERFAGNAEEALLVLR
jgi:predicted nuclease of predicted toxin-antitoxin system